MKVLNYKLIVETIQDGVFIISDGRMKYVNDSFIKMTGYSCDEIIDELYSNFIHDDDVAFVEDMHKKRMLGEDVPTEYEFRIKHKDGSTVYVMMNVGIIEFNGKPSATGTIKDITERINSELKIKDIENSYRTVLELCPDPIVISDFNGKILMHNQAAYDAHEPNSTKFKLRGRNVMDFMEEGDVADMVENMIPNDGGGMEKYTINMKTEKGRIIPFELHTTTIHDSQGVATCKLSIGRDISQIKEYEKELKKLIYEKDLNIQEIHHRIKNNLQQIYSLLGLQADSEFLLGTLKQSDCDCNECHLTMQRIINDARRRILAISLIHEMFYLHNTDCIEFSLFLKELSQNIKHTYDTTKKDVKVNITGDSFELCLDYIIPCGLIANEIIINSYKYAFKNGEPGVINIDLKSGNGLRTIIISDNGIGMSLNDIDDNKTLGLSLIRGLTEQINGTLSIGSDVGKGTTYKIEFVENRLRNREIL